MPVKGFRVPLDVRFWSKVNKRGPDECWEWTATRHRGGYGTIRVEGKVKKAHRISYELAHGIPPPDDMVVCHRCDNPPCVNPAHLWIGTYRQNNEDRNAKGRTAHQRGEDHPSAKLTEQTVLKMRELHSQGVMQKDLVKMFSLEKTRVSSIIRRKIWKHI